MSASDEAAAGRVYCKSPDGMPVNGLMHTRDEPAWETPAIAVHLVRNFEAPGGMGGPGTAVTAPALANAVFAATGKRIRKLPLQAEQLRSA